MKNFYNISEISRKYLFTFCCVFVVVLVSIWSYFFIVDSVSAAVVDPGAGQIITQWSSPQIGQVFYFYNTTNVPPGPDDILTEGDWQVFGPDQYLSIHLLINGAEIPEAPPQIFGPTPSGNGPTDVTVGTFSFSVPADTFSLGNYNMQLRAVVTPAPGRVELYNARPFSVEQDLNPAMVITPAPPYNFGSAVIDDPATAQDIIVTVENKGGGSVTGNVTSSNTNDFSCISGCSYDLTFGQTVGATLRFAPTTPGGSDAGIRSTQFTLTSSAGTDVIADGTGAAGITYEGLLFVEQGQTILSTWIPDQPVWEGDPATTTLFNSQALPSIDTIPDKKDRPKYYKNLTSSQLGKIYETIRAEHGAGDRDEPKQFRLYNKGTQILSVSVTGISNPPFRSESNTYVINPGEDIVASIIFEPLIDYPNNTNELHQQTVLFTNDATGRFARFDLKAGAVDYPIMLTYSITDGDFGPVDRGQSQATISRVYNDGIEIPYMPGEARVALKFTGPFSGPNGCYDGTAASTDPNKDDCVLKNPNPPYQEDVYYEEDRDFLMKYTPTAIGDQTGTVELHMKSGPQWPGGLPDPNPKIIPLKGIGVELQVDRPAGTLFPEYLLSTNRPMYLYDDTILGQSTTEKFILTNLSANPLDITVSFEDPAFSCSVCLFTLDPNGTPGGTDSINLDIIFTPPSEGSFAGWMTISLDDYLDDSRDLDTYLQGNGIESAFDLSPTYIWGQYFDETEVGLSNVRTFRIKSTSINPLIIPKENFTFPNPAFSCNVECPSINLPNLDDFEDFDVKFAPLAPGWYDGAIIVEAGVGDRNKRGLSGFAGSSVVPGDAIAHESRDAYDYTPGAQGTPSGPVEVGDWRDFVFTITNQGVGNLVGSVTIPDSTLPFSCITGCSYDLPRGGSQQATIRFEPTVDGEVPATEPKLNHIVATWNGNIGVQAIYIDGERSEDGIEGFVGQNPHKHLVGVGFTDNGELSDWVDGPLYVGKDRWASGYPQGFEGEIYRIAIYDKALTPTEIKQNFSTGESGALSATPIALYEFNEASGNWVRDSSGFGGDLDLYIKDLDRTTWISDGLSIDGPGYWGTSLRSVNSVSPSTPVNATKIKNAVQFSEEFTIETWVKPLSSDGYSNIVHLADTGATNLKLDQHGGHYAYGVKTTSANSPMDVFSRFAWTGGNAFFSGGIGGDYVILKGEGHAVPLISVEVDDGTGVFGPIPDPVDFGTVNEGSLSDPITFRVWNTGTAPLTGTLSLASPFDWCSGCSFTNIPPVGNPDNYKDITVRFWPKTGDSTSNPHQHTATFSSDGGNFSVNFEGTAIFVPIVSIGGGSIDFGNVEINTVKDITYTIVNNGFNPIYGLFTIDAGGIPPTGSFECISPQVTLGDPQVCEYDLLGNTTGTPPSVDIILRFSPTALVTYNTTATMDNPVGLLPIDIIGIGVPDFVDVNWKEF